MTTLTKSQLSWLSKMAKSGRLITRAITSDEIPGFAKDEFHLARLMVRALQVKQPDSGESHEESVARKNRRYREGASKGWVTRKRQAAARAAAREAKAA